VEGGYIMPVHIYNFLTKIDDLRIFRMIGGDGIIEVRKKSDNSVVISATLEHSYYQVYLIMKYGKIYSALIEN